MSIQPRECNNIFKFFLLFLILFLTFSFFLRSFFLLFLFIFSHLTILWGLFSSSTTSCSISSVSVYCPYAILSYLITCISKVYLNFPSLFLFFWLLEQCLTTCLFFLSLLPDCWSRCLRGLRMRMVACSWWLPYASWSAPPQGSWRQSSCWSWEMMTTWCQ